MRWNQVPQQRFQNQGHTVWQYWFLIQQKTNPDKCMEFLSLFLMLTRREDQDHKDFRYNLNDIHEAA